MDLTKGWILVHRSLLDCAIWESNEPFSGRDAWIDLLLVSNHRDKEIIFNKNPMTIKRGQYLTSVRKLADRWHWGKDKTLHYLRTLEKLNMITREADSTRTIITIVNYDIYQDFRLFMTDSNKDSQQTVDRQSTDTDQPQTNNVNNVNNVNKYNSGASAQDEKPKSKVFVPPTVEEVRVYCVERNNNIDAEQFVDFYTSKNWFVGKNKMKDWKASVRTWERGRKNDTSGTEKKLANKFNDFPQRGYDFGSIEKKLMGG